MYIRINFEGRKFHKSKFLTTFAIYCECISGNFSYSRAKILQKYIATAGAFWQKFVSQNFVCIWYWVNFPASHV